MNNHSFCVCGRSENRARWLFPNRRIFLKEWQQLPSYWRKLIAAFGFASVNSFGGFFFQTHWSPPTRLKGKTFTRFFFLFYSNALKFADSFERQDFHEIFGSHFLGDLENRSWNVMLCCTTPLLHENVVKGDPKKWWIGKKVDRV